MHFAMVESEKSSLDSYATSSIRPTHIARCNSSDSHRIRSHQVAIKPMTPASQSLVHYHRSTTVPFRQSLCIEGNVNARGPLLPKWYFCGCSGINHLALCRAASIRRIHGGRQAQEQRPRRLDRTWRRKNLQVQTDGRTDRFG